MNNQESNGQDSKVEGPKIEFPNDPEVVDKLRNKLEEYKSRLEEDEENNKFQPPEISKPRTADTRYKIAVLEKVLEGNADTYSIAKELREQDGGFFDKATFENACGVIENYATGSGKGVKGGTGLSSRKERGVGKENEQDSLSEKEKSEKIKELKDRIRLALKMGFLVQIREVGQNAEKNKKLREELEDVLKGLDEVQDVKELEETIKFLSEGAAEEVEENEEEREIRTAIENMEKLVGKKLTEAEIEGVKKLRKLAKEIEDSLKKKKK